MHYRLLSLLLFYFGLVAHIQATARTVEIVNNTHQTINFIDHKLQLHTLRPASYCSATIETTAYFTWSIISAHHISWHYSLLDPEVATIQFDGEYTAHVVCSSKPDCIDRFIRRIIAYGQHFCDGLTLGLLTNSTEIMDIENRRGSHICYGVGMFTTLYTIVRCIQRDTHAI